jgi:predicted phosphodiesterase
MKKYFFCSDIHAFYTSFSIALKQSGFDAENPDHILVVLGDVFDRGLEVKNTYKFLTSLPKDRLVLIRGNHESLYKSLLDKSFPDSYDFSNGTVSTFCQIAGFSEELLHMSYWVKLANREGKDVYEYQNMPKEYWGQILDIVKSSEITKWIYSDAWVNYFETPNYICVHSWLPVRIMSTEFNTILNKVENTVDYREDWRNATDTEWSDATWGCPWQMAKIGLNESGKTIMCGHWHTSDFYNHLTKRKKDIYHNPIFKSKRYKLVGLDACTAITYKVNVLVLTEEEL